MWTDASWFTILAQEDERVQKLAVALVIATVSVSHAVAQQASGVAGQTSAAHNARGTAAPGGKALAGGARGTSAAGTKAKAPRTPWGTPDLQGQWTGSTITPLERPAKYADRTHLTAQEAAALEADARARAAEEPKVGAGDPGTYNQVWFDPAASTLPDRRTSLIIDPPDGKLPFTPDGRKFETRAGDHYGRGVRDNPEDFDTGERCLTDGLPLPFFTGYNNNVQIIQTPQYVAIQAEMFHDFRLIPLDGRPRVSAQWLGESRGHWEGDTLVVETENFLDKGRYWWANSWRASRATLKVVERFTRIDDETMDYEFTWTDPSQFTRPWTAKYPLTTNQAARGVTQGLMYEYACHEGNQSLINVLKGARSLGDLSGAAPAPR